MLQLIPFTKALANEWDALVTQSPDGWTWALTSWRRTILAVERWGLQDHSFAVSDGHRLVAVMPLQYFPAGNRMESSGWGLCGPIVANGIEGKYREKILNSIFAHCEQLSRKLEAVEMRLGFPPLTHSSLYSRWQVNPYIFYGFEDCSLHSQIIDLSNSEAELWNRTSELAKRKIKKAIHLKYHVELVNWCDYIDQYYKIHTETYVRTGVQPHPKIYFQGIANNMSVHGHSLLWCCFDNNNNPVGFHNTSFFNNTAYYHTGCSNTEHMNNGINYLLFWNAIIGSKRRGANWYECGLVFPLCSDRDDKRYGLTEFKTKFGGIAHRAFICKKTFTYPIQHIPYEPGCKTLFHNFVRSVLLLSKGIVKYLKKNFLRSVTWICMIFLKNLWFTTQRIYQKNSMTFLRKIPILPFSCVCALPLSRSILKITIRF